MNIIHKITQAVEPSLEAMGYALVQVRLAEGSRRRTLTVMAERRDGNPMSFDDCAQISRMASALLEVDDPISGAYDLEVCSPGLDRPLTKPEDFTRFAGCEARVETLMPVDGRKRFRGNIVAAGGETVGITMPEGEVRLSFGNIRTAKLIPALVAGSGKKTKT